MSFYLVYLRIINTPCCSPNENYNEADDAHYMEDITDRRLKDHNDLHVLDLGKIVGFIYCFVTGCGFD